MTALIDAPPIVKKFPRCSNCGAFVNRYCKVDTGSGEWGCIFCEFKNSTPEYIERYTYVEHPELMNLDVDYIDFEKEILETNGERPGYLLLIDINIDQSELSKLKVAVLDALRLLDPSTPIALITFSNVIQIFELRKYGVASAHVIHGIASLQKEDVLPIIENLRNFVVPLRQCIETLSNILVGLISTAPEPPKGRNSQSTETVKQYRALGVAIEVSLNLLADFGGSIIGFINGAPNFGPGRVSDTIDDPSNPQSTDNNEPRALSYFRELSLISLKNNIIVDLFCAGLKSFRVKVLQKLVLNNGGKVIMHPDFGSEFARDLKLAIFRHIGKKGIFSIRTSSTISCKHIIAPAVDISPDVESDSMMGPLKPEDNAQYCLMTGLQARNCFTVYFELNGSIVADAVYFQFVVQFLTLDNKCMYRVITRMLPTTGNVINFLSSVDPDVVSILIAKKTVLLARSSHDLTPVFNYLDETLYDILTHCDHKDKSKDAFVLPKSLSKLPKKFYLLRRGPMLGPILQHPDDIDYIRCLFLFSNFEDSKRLIEPSLMVLKQKYNWNLTMLPLEDLALQSDHILILDHHTDIFIWSGSEVQDHTYDEIRKKCVQYTHEISMHRFPQPHIRVFSEGSSMARWLQCRLIPSHKDSPAEQIKSFPQIGELSPEAKKQLLSKFHRTDDLSFNQYYRSLFK